MLLKCLLHSSKLDKGLAPGFFRRHAAPEVFFHRHFQMGGNFFVDLVIESIIAEERADSVDCCSKGIPHGSTPSPCIARTRPMTPASRCQYAASFANCF